MIKSGIAALPHQSWVRLLVYTIELGTLNFFPAVHMVWRSHKVVGAREAPKSNHTSPYPGILLFCSIFKLFVLKFIFFYFYIVLTI